jgi:diacylglycerol O-acyltransferase / wax synthase
MTRAPSNRRLTTQDASFLYIDRPNQPMHGAWVGLYDGRLSLDEVIRIIEGRLHLIPRYRQKVVFPPFGLAHPTWEDDTEFDVRRHISEEMLPAPGDDRAVATVVGRLLAPQMDRSRPLWQMVVLDGRGDGNTAVVTLVHHAMVDGVSGVDLMMVTHDLTADAKPPAVPTTPWKPAATPDALSLLEDAVRDQLVEAAARWTDDAFRQFRAEEAAARAQQITNAMLSSMPSVLRPAPATPFNNMISGERDVSWAQFRFPEIRAIRAVLGGTINDVVLAVVAGALGQYLRHRGLSTDGVELRAMCPVSMRRPEGRGALGNQVSMMIAPLFVGILDPVERLRAEREAMERLKEQDQAGGFYALTEQGNATPPAVQAFLGQFEAPNTLLNTVSTNIPGPQIPLYMGGHKLLANFGFGMLSANIGLFNAIGSYNQVLTIGATVDPRQVPDAWFYADCLRESFSELLEAAGKTDVEGGPHPVATAKVTPVPAGRPAR